MPTTGYLGSTSFDVPVLPVSQPASTASTSQSASVSSVPTGTSTSSAPAQTSSSGPAGFEQLVSPDQASVVCEDDT